MARVLLGGAALLLLVATALGAYASHGLEGVLTARALASLETAIEYQFYHGLGLLAAAILADRYPERKLFWAAGGLFVAGIVLFCGSIYLITFGGPAGASRAAPVGGICFMAGWLSLAFAAIRLPAARADL
ncbi:MAG TPA: DUF423 domain-containing protein [Gammaproteobacteria bacterium]